mgnify:CR=1 FL=1
MNDIRQLSREELLHLVSEQAAQVAEQAAQLAEHEAERAALLASHESLRADLASVITEHTELSRAHLALEAKHLAIEIAHGLLQEKYSLLIQEHFGRSSERYLADPEALRHDLESDLPAETESGQPSPTRDALHDAVDGLRDACQEVAGDEAAAPETPPTKRSPAPRRAPRRGPPEHLRREVRDVLIEDAADRGLKLIGYDETETLVQIPAQLYVRRLRYAKYVDPRRPELGVFTAKRAPGSWRATCTMRAWRPRSSSLSMRGICRSIGSRTSSLRAAGRLREARC